MNKVKRIFGIFSLIICAYVLMGATTNAIYLHHERSTLANLESDLQNRELGLNPTDRTAVVRFSSGLYGHLISQEQPAVALTGTLSLTGAASLLSNATIAGTLGVTGAQTGSKITLSDSLKAATVRATGNLSAGGTFTASGASTLAALSATTGSFSSTLAVAGVQTNSEALVFTGSGTGGTGRIYNSATNGLSIRANTGSSYDWYLSSVSNNTLIRNPTGTATLEFPNAVNISGNLTLSSLSSGRIPIVSTAGLITQDNLYWDATNDRLGIGSGASSPASIIDATESNSGTSTIRLVNSNSAATGGSVLLLSANGASGGDAAVNFNINGVTNWSLGSDNSDADAFVITPSSTPGGATNGLRISTAGAVSVPSLTASLPVFTDASKNLVSNTMTGTGSVVMSTSPTLVTPTLGVASATSMTLGGGEAFTYGDTSFTLTVTTGMTTTPSGTAQASRIGRIVTLEIPYLIGTSNAATFVISGIPSGYRPSSASQTVSLPLHGDNGNTESGGYAIISTTGTIDLSRRDAAAWTSSGNKYVSGTITYLVR